MDSRFVKLLTAIGFVFLGIMFFSRPDTVTSLLTVALGVVALTYSVTCFLRYRRTNEKLSLVLGIILAIISFVFILQPVLKLSFFDKLFGIVLAFVLIVSGVFLIRNGLAIAEQGRRFFEIALGSVVIVLGIINLLNPSLHFLSIMIGLACLAIGAVQIFDFIRNEI